MTATGFDKPFEHSEALLAAALEEFATHGYVQASINAILKAASMSKGQFYYHFENKANLYLALIGVVIARKREFMAKHMGQDELQHDIFTLLETQIRYGLDFARENPVIQRFTERFLRERGTPIYDRALATYNFVDNALFDHLVDQAYQRGDLRTDLPRAFVRQIIGYLFTHSADVTDMHNVADAERQLRHLIAMLRHGLARRE